MSRFIAALDEFDKAINAERFRGYGPLRIPHELDGIPKQFIQSYQVAEASERSLLSSLGRSAASVLVAFSERQASLAVRSRSEEILIESALAVGLSAVVTNDEREGILVMSLVWRTAELLGLKPKDLFVRGAERLPLIGRRALTSFTGRKAENQTLACMGYVEGRDADGFRYVRNW